MDSMGEKFTAPTLWGSTAFMADNLTQVTEELFVLKSDFVLPTMKDSIASFEASEKNATIQSNVTKEIRAVKHLLTRI